jgi:hypothetical protein
MFNRRIDPRKLGRRVARDAKLNPRELEYIQNLQAAGAQPSVSELGMLEQMAQREMLQAEQKRRLRNNIDEKQARRKRADGDQLSDDEQQILDTALKQHQQRQFRNTAIGAAGLALGAGGIAAGGVAAQQLGLNPFSNFDLNEEAAELVKQQFLIEDEMKKRQHQDDISMRMSMKDADLQQKLGAIEQQMTLEAQLTQQLKQQSTQGPNGFDIEQKVNQLAGEFMQQGLDPNQAFSKAIDVTGMQARNQGYL